MPSSQERLGDGRTLIDEYTAEILAVDYVSTPKTFSDVSLRFTAAIRGWDDDEPQPERGFLVGLTVNGVNRLVTVATNGTVLGVSSDVKLEGLDKLGV